MKFKLSRVFSIAAKEISHILRDPFTLIIALGLPIILVAFFGYAIDFEVKNITLRQTVVSGIPQKIRSDADFLSYPNPANKELNISFELESTSDIHMQLFSLTGQLIETVYRGRQDPGHQEIIFDTEKLASGAYMLHLSNGSFSNSRVVLIQH